MLILESIVLGAPDDFFLQIFSVGRRNTVRVTNLGQNLGVSDGDLPHHRLLSDRLCRENLSETSPEGFRDHLRCHIDSEDMYLCQKTETLRNFLIRKTKLNEKDVWSSENDGFQNRQKKLPKNFQIADFAVFVLAPYVIP